MTRKHIAIDERLHRRLEREKGSDTWDGFFRRLLRDIESAGEGAEKLPTLKPIITKFPGPCFYCGETIEVGEPALWGKTLTETILVCQTCQVQKEGDRALAMRYIKKRKLERTIKALQREADLLAGQMEELTIVQRFRAFFDVLLQDHNFLMQWIGQPFTQDKEREIAEEHASIIERAMPIIREIEDFFESRKLKKLRA